MVLFLCFLFYCCVWCQMPLWSQWKLWHKEESLFLSIQYLYQHWKNMSPCKTPYEMVNGSVSLSSQFYPCVWCQMPLWSQGKLWDNDDWCTWSLLFRALFLSIHIYTNTGHFSKSEAVLAKMLKWFHLVNSKAVRNSPLFLFGSYPALFHENSTTVSEVLF